MVPWSEVCAYDAIKNHSCNPFQISLGKYNRSSERAVVMQSCCYIQSVHECHNFKTIFGVLGTKNRIPTCTLTPKWMSVYTNFTCASMYRSLSNVSVRSNGQVQNET